MGVDLHLHSTASDGRHRPADLVNMAYQAGLTIISLTDHDSTEGIAEAVTAAGKLSSIKVIPGVEIGTDVLHGEVHLLGYFIDYQGEELNRTLSALRDSRQMRATRMIAKLYNLGMDIEWRRVQELAGAGSIGRPHIAQALLEKGYVGTFKEAFDRFIGRDGPAYVERDKMTPEEAVALILKAGGLAVLAHPTTAPDLPDLVGRLKKAGLVGLEVYYAKASTDDVGRMKKLARNYGLIATGGSDFHGLNAEFEVPLGQAPIPQSCAAKLIALAEQSGHTVL